IVHSESGILWQGAAFNDRTAILMKSAHVAKGDTIDLVISAGATTSFDSFSYESKIIWTPQNAPDAAPEKFVASDAFGPPPPTPLAPAEQLAQVLLMTNEFI